MTVYTVVTGDTFDSISRKNYGTEQQSDFIARANPGVFEPLAAGTTLTIPVLPDAPQNVQQQAADVTENEVAILIDGERFRFWDSVRITRSIDAMDIIEFSAPFESEAPGFRETFRPFSFKNMVVTVGGDPLFTGTMIAVNPVLENASKTLSIGGYSLPGVLNDCTPPASMFGKQGSKLQTDDQGLREIATTLAAPFGISVEFLADQGSTFERVAIEPGKKILPYLTKLAQQRNLIISSSSRGKLIFLQSSDGGQPVAKLQQGSAPVLSVTPFFSPQEYYSHITGIEPVFLGFGGSQFPVKNPHLLGIVRPFTFNIPDTLDADIEQAVEAKVGRMFGNMASYSVSVATWRDPSGNLWEPNTSITLLAPDAMIYTSYEFIIRSIEFSKDSATETATLNLMIPGSFSGKIPEVLPWDE